MTRIAKNWLYAAIEYLAIERISNHFPEEHLPVEDRRRLHRYERRWLVERFFAWLQWQRRLMVRREYQ